MTSASGSSTRTGTDWIELFLDYTDGVPSPPLFRLWSGIAALAAVLEQRVYVESTGERVFPNLYTLLVAPPGVGKTQIIKDVAKLWRSIPNLHVAPDNMTKAALVDTIQKSLKVDVLGPLNILTYSSLQVAADELGVLMPTHDLDFLSTLNKIYDNPAFYVEARRMFKDKPIAIEAPQINLLAGAQPGFLSSVFPEEAWTMGFTSRLIMLYSSIPITVELFDTPSRSPEKFTILGEELKRIASLNGPFRWTQDAKAAVVEWNRSGRPPVPQHTKLEHYNARRILHMLKLLQVSCLSRSNEMVITKYDFDRALIWMVGAERSMPDVFRSMTQKSDALIIQELHAYAWQIYVKNNKEPVHRTRLMHFLSTRVMSDKAPKILELAERAGYLNRMAGTDDQFKPVPKEELME